MSSSTFRTRKPNELHLENKKLTRNLDIDSRKVTPSIEFFLDITYVIPKNKNEMATKIQRFMRRILFK